MDKIESSGRFRPSAPPYNHLNVGIAVNKSESCMCVVQWALDYFAPRGNVVMKLIHVRSRIGRVPASMIGEVEESAQREIEFYIVDPCKKMCAEAKVEVDFIVVQSDDVANAIADEVSKLAITKLVIGASSHGFFSWKPKNLSAEISACVPSFCTVYTVSKRKLLSERPSDTSTIVGSLDENSYTRSVASDTYLVGSSAHFVVSGTSYACSSSQTDRNSDASRTNFHYPSLTMQRFQAPTTVNQNLLGARKDSFDRYHSQYWTPTYDGPALSHASSSGRSLATEIDSCFSDLASTSSAAESSSSESQVNINLELEKLRIELRHAKRMCAMAESEKNDASQKLKDLNAQLLDEGKKLEEIKAKEDKAKESIRDEKEKHKMAKREARYVMQCVETEASMKMEAERKAANDTKERKKLENALAGSAQRYKQFTWEEIVSATSSFSEDLKIGMGGYGTIYKGCFHHTMVAVKVLHSNESHKSQQFQKELEIMSQIHHPHLLLLIGACPDRGCLVYEYMENGSLDDRLSQKNNTPPIPWFERYRIAWEVAAALAFLHSSKPEPIIHRDLKPANILLDRNLVSKIGNVGLATMLQQDEQFSTSAVYRDTGPVGTLWYMDPEYQITGLISPKSDVFSLGMVILQLLTAMRPKMLAHLVETAIGDGNLASILDKNAGRWPPKETKELAELALGCVELCRRDRPDVQDQVLPMLARLKEVADKARDSASMERKSPSVPNHFICPIRKDVMMNPYVASDGYTYDREVIQQWLEENDTSPMTKLPLLSKTLIPNNSLLSAIQEWKSNEP